MLSQNCQSGFKFEILWSLKHRYGKFECFLIDRIWYGLFCFSQGMATPVEPPNGIGTQGKHYYSMWQTLFEIDTKYVPIKPIGRGAYGIVCSSVNRETNEKVAIKKINNAFENRVDALRTLRELKLLRHLRHDNVIALKDVMMPINRKSFKDVYLVYELMDTDLHQIIKSSQALSNDHCQYFLFQVYTFADHKLGKVILYRIYYCFESWSNRSQTVLISFSLGLHTVDLKSLLRLEQHFTPSYNFGNLVHILNLSKFTNFLVHFWDHHNYHCLCHLK